jgi:hypothetical protein
MGLGIMLYLGGSLFYYLLVDQLTSSEVDLFGKLTYIFEIVKNLLFSLAIIMYLKKETTIKKTELPNLDFTH